MGTYGYGTGHDFVTRSDTHTHGDPYPWEWEGVGEVTTSDDRHALSYHRELMAVIRRHLPLACGREGEGKVWVVIVGGGE